MGEEPGWGDGFLLSMSGGVLWGEPFSVTAKRGCEEARVVCRVWRGIVEGCVGTVKRKGKQALDRAGHVLASSPDGIHIPRS